MTIYARMVASTSAHEHYGVNVLESGFVVCNCCWALYHAQPLFWRAFTIRWLSPGCMLMFIVTLKSL
jgi:hypothetical protein